MMNPQQANMETSTRQDQFRQQLLEKARRIQQVAAEALESQRKPLTDYANQINHVDYRASCVNLNNNNHESDRLFMGYQEEAKLKRKTFSKSSDRLVKREHRRHCQESSPVEPHEKHLQQPLDHRLPYALSVNCGVDSANSSGFLSGGSGRSHRSSQCSSSTSNITSIGNSSSCSQWRTIRDEQVSRRPTNKRPASSRVIDDLHRLMYDADRCSASSPADSYLSEAQFGPDSTLMRRGEFDYSTLCRDEFSSFIQAEPQSDQQQPLDERLPKSDHFNCCPDLDQIRAGPMLVGVHEANAPREALYSSSSLSSDSNLYETQQMLASPSSNISGSSRSNSIDKELVMLEQDTCRDRPAQSNKLSDVLDVYLSRIESLLRLSSGDKSVSLLDAFGDEPEIEVSDEHRTEIEYKPIENANAKLRVIQELNMVELGADQDQQTAKVILAVNTASSDFRSILSWPNTSAQLNWPEQQSDCIDNDQIDDLQTVSRLEASLLEKLEARSSQRHLVNTVKRHLSEFIDNYNHYQRQLRLSGSLANDWTQNWLFASKRASDPTQSQAKRAKLSAEQQQVDEQPPLDLLKYSTLLLNRSRKANQLNCLASSEALEDIERVYLEQEESLSELYASLKASAGQVDLCRLLVCDNQQAEETCKRPKSVSKVNYLSSSLQRLDASLFQFCAFGYLFEFPIQLSTSDRRRRKDLRRKILLRMLQLIESRPEQIPRMPAERVSFAVSMENVELVNKLPVIQFCAKVSGSLPIRVRWFRCEQELSDPRKLSADCASSFRLRRAADRSESEGVEWPIEMLAEYDYEYQTGWSSWLRFRRRQDEIVFEIRDPSLDEDYEQSYKCQVENFCSVEVCHFSLSKRKLIQSEQSKKSKVENDEQICDTNPNKQAALLRTWSQRTLHRPTVVEQPEKKKSRAEEGGRVELATTCGTLDRHLLAQQSVLGKDKFGKDFPYHPENLLKRLEENKFGVSKRCKVQKNNQMLACNTQVADSSNDTATTTTSTNQVQFMHFTDSFFELNSTEEPDEKRQICSGFKLTANKVRVGIIYRFFLS